MLFLLRNIRRKLISTDLPAGKARNKIITYLLYAIGEIILVVVGILIAVSIDDWSEGNKRKAAEKKILMEISTNLDGDLEEIRDDIWGYKYTMSADSALIDNFFSSDGFNDLLGSYAYVLTRSPHFNPSIGGYTLMESKGIDIISNDSLRIHLSDFYERSIPYYWKYENERVHAVQNIFFPLTMKNFSMGDFTGSLNKRLIPFNYDELRKNNEWLLLIQTSSNFARIMLIRSE